MDRETVSIIGGIFYLLPWWLKIILVLFIISIPIGIFEAIREMINGNISRRKISEQINVNPELALQTAVASLESDAFTLDEYEGHLTKIAENTGHIGAILKLIELYDGEKYKEKKNEEKCAFWRRRAAKAGDIASIMDYYGFSDYDVLSDSCDEIISDLNNVDIASQSEQDVVSYLKGIVYYKKGTIDLARQSFASISSTDLAQERGYMLFQCYMKVSNIVAAENVLDNLEKDDFEIPATDYLNLYNYYVAQREGAEPNYGAEMKYVEKYAKSQGADYETTCNIGGNTYYNAAVAMENGRSGFEKDFRSALVAYKKAADFGHAESLYYVGMNFLQGEFRNYHKANEYLLKAAQKGYTQAETILGQYGIEGILVAPMQVDEVHYQFMDGYEMTASGDTMKWLALLYGIEYKAIVLADEFSDSYEEAFHSFEELMNGIYQLYTAQVAKMLGWGIRLLMSFGIDTYDAQSIIDESEDLALLPRVPLFEQGLDRIDARAEELDMKLAYAQAARGTWSGAGFGTTVGGVIKASVKASVAAGAMNIGSGILHGIGDGIAGSMHNAEIKKMGETLFKKPATLEEFGNAVLSACLDIGTVLREIVETHCNLSLEALKGKIKFGDENLCDIDERVLDAKINNNLSVANNEYAYALLIERLRRHPLHQDTLNQIIIITIRRSSYGSRECEEILRYACDFGLEGYATVLREKIDESAQINQEMDEQKEPESELQTFEEKDRNIEPEENGESSVIELMEIGSNKVQVIKVIREAMNLGLKEAKDLVDSAPPIVLKFSQKDADNIRNQLELAGAKVMLKSSQEPKTVREKQGNTHMIACANCGKMINGDAKFCNFCGNKIVKMDTYVCANCGKPIKKDSKFCQFCGSKNENMKREER